MVLGVLKNFHNIIRVRENALTYGRDLISRESQSKYLAQEQYIIAN